MGMLILRKIEKFVNKNISIDGRKVIDLRHEFGIWTIFHGKPCVTGGSFNGIIIHIFEMFLLIMLLYEL